MIAVTEPVSQASDIAHQLTGRWYLSWSAISTYLKCPLRYAYHYLDQLPEEFVSSNLIFGSAIHSALEMFFRERLSGNQSLGIGDLMAIFHQAWTEANLSEVQFNHGEDLNSLGALADRMLQAFLRSPLSQPSGSITGIVEEFQSPVIPGCPDLFARLDLMVESKCEVFVTDFKTARSRWSTAEANASEGQLLIYHELVQEISVKPIRLQFVVITKTKQPDVQLIRITPEQRRIERMRRLVQNVWTGIQSGNFYPVPSPINCPACGYRDRCSRWNG